MVLLLKATILTCYHMTQHYQISVWPETLGFFVIKYDKIPVLRINLHFTPIQCHGQNLVMLIRDILFLWRQKLLLV